MSRYRLTVAYDGRPFAGWQSQPGSPTIQDALEEAISLVLGDGNKRLRIHGSGRTDAGVHSTGQVAHFDAPEGSSLGATDWQRALNAHLPETIRVMDSEEVDADFHARFSATGKTYEYRIQHGEVLPPHEAGRAWHIRGAIDTDVLMRGLTAIEGRHNFHAFAASRGDASDLPDSQERTIFEASLAEEGSVLILRFRGEGFLYKMVRLLTGGLVRCAQGKAGLEWFLGMLNHPSDKCTHCAPAAGLYLVDVQYCKSASVPADSRSLP